MSKILVHLHIYYEDMVEEMLHKISNITEDYNLYVTLVKENKELQEKITSFNPHAQFFVLENKGFDVYPFLYVIQQVNLDEYNYIIKLHTKRNLKYGTYLDCWNVSGAKWRNYLTEFIQTKENFIKALKHFEQNPKLGMVGNYKILCSDINDEHYAESSDIIQKLTPSGDTSLFSYIQGCMFMARAKLFQPLKRLDLNNFTFEKSEHGSLCKTPYIFERVFGHLVTSQRYLIRDIFNPIWYQKLSLMYNTIKEFMIKCKLDKKNNLIVKVCKIQIIKIKHGK